MARVWRRRGDGLFRRADSDLRARRLILPAIGSIIRSIGGAMDITLEITTEQAQGKVPVTVFHLQGWLDAQSEEQLLAAAREAHDAGARFLLLDLAEVDTLTSAGMRAMQKVYKLFTPPGEQFKVA